MTLMTYEELERQYIADLARISGTSVTITQRLIDVQLIMLLKDLGIIGESQTIFGKVSLDKDKNLVITNPNPLLVKIVNKGSLIDKLIKELGD